MRGKDMMDAIASALGDRPMTSVQWVADNVLMVTDDDGHHHVITVNDYIGIRHPASYDPDARDRAWLDSVLPPREPKA